MTTLSRAYHRKGLVFQLELYPWNRGLKLVYHRAEAKIYKSHSTTLSGAPFYEILTTSKSVIEKDLYRAIDIACDQLVQEASTDSEYSEIFYTSELGSELAWIEE